ncbi:hypothetical protein T11_16224 [Trichinella zimbabwensis]|uniref:Uncharacterized protein n=1 Tax=Trichinella zimbabwensis TaxID=268475 RepID=A0A0V1GWA3_9BILA|nr:hypothetical protein T11_16224 [Trichinella zimbabwensis]
MKTEALANKVAVRRVKRRVMVDYLTQLCEVGSHPDEIRELLDEVMAFCEQALELLFQLSRVRNETRRTLSGRHSTNGSRGPAEQREPRFDNWKTPYPSDPPDPKTLTAAVKASQRRMERSRN